VNPQKTTGKKFEMSFGTEFIGDQKLYASLMITVGVPERQHNRNRHVRKRLATSALVAVVLSSTVFLVLPATASGLKITGASCKKLGIKTTTQNKNYQCVKKGNKLVWSLRTPVIQAKPTGSTPSKPTLSPSPSPSPESTPFALPDPNTLTISEAAAKYMAENTVVIPRLDGCSGSLVRNSSGESIGIITAEHCSLKNIDTKRVLESDGRYSITFASPVNTYYGDVPSQLQNAGVVDKFYLPAVEDATIDFVYGAFTGHSLSDVITAYDASRLEYADIKQLKAGDIIYSSGWPIYQPKNTTGDLSRREFSLIIVGVEDRLTNGYAGNTSIVWAAVPADKYDSVCSFGDSGSIAFKTVDGNSKNIGVLAVFEDYTGNNYGVRMLKDNPVDFENKYNVSGLSKYSAVCGFAYETPTPQNGGMEVYVKVVPPTPAP
jgi:hypothetical protein